MAFDNLTEFFAMGGHGLYVWLAYGATYLVLGALTWVSLRGHRRALQAAHAQHLRTNAAT